MSTYRSGREPFEPTGSRRCAGLLAPSMAPSVLGTDHPVSRVAVVVHMLARQGAATSGAVALAILAVAEHRPWGLRLLGAAVLVEFCVVCALCVASQLLKERVLGLIACGRWEVPLPEVSREVRRLSRSQHAPGLARRLHRALEEARDWHQLPVASRPPGGIRVLAALGEDVAAIIEQLQSDRATLPALALLELLLVGGYDSVLYRGDEQQLGEQLARIRRLVSWASEADRAGE
jgi:hypothetical protein